MRNEITGRRDQANRLLFHAVCSPYMENVIESAHEIFDRPVLFLDEYFHLVNMSPEEPMGMPLWDSIFREKALHAEEKDALLRELQDSETGISYVDGSPFRGLLAPVLLDRRNRGYVLVFWEGQPPAEEDMTLMDMVLQAVRVRASTRTRTIGSWNISLCERLKELLEVGKDLPEKTAKTQVMESSLSTMYAICVVPMGPLPAQRDFAQEAVQQLQQQHHNVICLIHGNAIVLLCTGLPTVFQEQDIRDTYLMKKLTEFFAGKDMILGISDRFHMLHTVYSHYRQAVLAASMAERMGKPGAASFTQLMPLPLFMPLAEKHDIAAFIPPELMAVREYDRIHGTGFMETLKTYSLGLFHKRQAARALHIHVNTLCYRLEQVETLFGLGSETQKDQLRLVCSFLILGLVDQTEYLPDTSELGDSHKISL